MDAPTKFDYYQTGTKEASVALVLYLSERLSSQGKAEPNYLSLSYEIRELDFEKMDTLIICTLLRTLYAAHRKLAGYQDWVFKATMALNLRKENGYELMHGLLDY